MAAYILVDTKVTDPTRYDTYKKLAEAAIARHGGRYLVRGGEHARLEGTWNPNRIVLLEFATVEKARAFYDSAEYLVARAAREGAANMNMVVVAGL